MKLNEVFTPLSEDGFNAYSNVEGLGEYEEIVIKALKEGNYLYRGMVDTGKVIIGDSSGNDRSKRYHNSNVVNTFVDHLDPRWQKFPKREKSFICSTGKEQVSLYGAPFLCIPVENNDIGLCPDFDFWYSFGQDNHVAIFSQTFVEMLKSLVEEGILTDFKQGNVVEPNQLKEYIKLVDEKFVLKKPWRDQKMRIIYQQIMDEGGVANYLKNTYAPDNFSIIKPSDLSMYIRDDQREAWFEGKAVFVLETYAKEQGWVK